MLEEERRIRRKLGAPDEAEKVIVFAESSHWDPNWLLTSKEYYKLCIQKNLDRALDELEKEPARVYSVECVFFLKMYWDRRPERRDKVRELVNEGRLRLTGSGVTTPDTLLPDDEAIIRDFLIGQEWLRNNGMDQEPRLAYLPDDFGHSAALPSLLAAVGCDMAAFARIDGCYFPGADYRSKKQFPLPGSSAELLQKDLKSLDFVWRGPDGAEALCHWMAFTYFQGDMIADRGLIKWMGFTIGVPARGPKAVSDKVRGYIRQLEPLSRTPYMFCPIGCDFVGPIPRLCSILDRYNRTAYQDTGVWAVLAGLDDYLELVDLHREALPTIELDPNPHWMGFYSARPEIKQRLRSLCRDLVTAEKLCVIAGENGAEFDDGLADKLAKSWWTAAVGNHHDFITGTSPGRVWNKEQRPWLIDAQAGVEEAIDKVVPLCPAPPKARAALPVEWRLGNGRLTVESTFYEIELDERLGGCVTRWNDFVSGTNVLTGLGADLVCHRDSGGLWRMGHEYAGGVYYEIERASDGPAVIRAHEHNGLLEVEVSSMLDGRKVTRRFWFRSDSPAVRMRVEGRVKDWRTVTARMNTVLNPLSLTMDSPGGVTSRPLAKIYEPTYWPAKSFAHVRDRKSGLGLALYCSNPAAVHADSNGVVEWVALRNAPIERAFRILPVLSHPARGPVRGEQGQDFAIRFTPEGDWRGNQLYLGADKFLGKAWIDPGGPDLGALAGSMLITDNEEVLVKAVKKADRGEGYIVRIANHHAIGHVAGLKFRHRRIERAFLCDGRERDLREIEVDEEGTALVPLESNIISVRVF